VPVWVAKIPSCGFCKWYNYVVLLFVFFRYTRKNAQVVTLLQQTCSNAVPTTCQQDVFPLHACSQLVGKLLITCYKVVELNRLVTSCSNTCYRPAIQQFVNTLRVTTL
jgi:hypothetical protein